MTTDTDQITYTIPSVSCSGCVASITGAVEKVEGVSAVDVDLASKLVIVRGPALDDAALRAAIDDAGYDIAA